MTTTTETASDRNNNDRPASNFIALRSGRTLTAAQITAACTTAARRIIKIEANDDGAASSPATIHLPAARDFLPLELIVVDASGGGFILTTAAPETISGDPGLIISGGDAPTHRYGRAAVRLVPLLGGDAGGNDGWAVI